MVVAQVQGVADGAAGVTGLLEPARFVETVGVAVVGLRLDDDGVGSVVAGRRHESVDEATADATTAGGAVDEEVGEDPLVGEADRVERAVGLGEADDAEPSRATRTSDWPPATRSSRKVRASCVGALP